MTTVSLGESVGTRHVSTQSSNRAALIGPSKVFAAVRPKAKAGDQSHRFVVTVRDGRAQAAPAPATSVFAREIGGGSCLVNENELRRIEIELPGEPFPASTLHVRALLFLGMRRFFKGDLVTVEETPQHGDRKALAAIGDQPLLDLSSSVMSGMRRIRPRR